MKQADGSDLTYKQFPKGDARRYLLVLLTIDHQRKTGATTYSVATALAATRAEVERAMQALVTQFGVVLRREPSKRRADFSQYSIESWGVLSRKAAEELIGGKLSGALLDTDGSKVEIK